MLSLVYYNDERIHDTSNGIDSCKHRSPCECWWRLDSLSPCPVESAGRLVPNWGLWTYYLQLVRQTICMGQEIGVQLCSLVQGDLVVPIDANGANCVHHWHSKNSTRPMMLLSLSKQSSSRSTLPNRDRECCVVCRIVVTDSAGLWWTCTSCTSCSKVWSIGFPGLWDCR